MEILAENTMRGMRSNDKKQVTKKIEELYEKFKRMESSLNKRRRRKIKQRKKTSLQSMKCIQSVVLRSKRR